MPWSEITMNEVSIKTYRIRFVEDVKQTMSHETYPECWDSMVLARTHAEQLIIEQQQWNARSVVLHPNKLLNEYVVGCLLDCIGMALSRYNHDFSPLIIIDVSELTDTIELPEFDLWTN